MNRFHCCASCIHFAIEKSKKKQYCTRLGFETKTFYQFDCWIPKEKVKKLMEKEKLSD